MTFSVYPGAYEFLQSLLRMSSGPGLKIGSVHRGRGAGVGLCDRRGSHCSRTARQGKVECYPGGDGGGEREEEEASKWKDHISSDENMPNIVLVLCIYFPFLFWNYIFLIIKAMHK